MYHHGNHPIKWVRLTGVVVAADEYSGRRVYTLDDSSGMCIECTAVAPAAAKSAVKVPVPRHLDQLNALSKIGEPVGPKTESAVKKRDKHWQPSTQDPDVPWELLDVGMTVKVKGKVGEFRDVKQIEVIKIEIVNGLDAEVKCWNEMMRFGTDVLAKPWVVSEIGELQCRKEKERGLRRAMKASETEEQRRRRKLAERREREEKRERQERMRGKKEREAQMRPPSLPVSARKGRIPLAVLIAAPGTYDALGL